MAPPFRGLPSAVRKCAATRSTSAANLRIAGALAAPARQPPQVAHEQLVSRMRDRAVGEEPARPPGTARSASCSAVAARRQTTSAVRSAGPSREEAIERVPRDQTPFEQRRQPLPRPRDRRAAPARAPRPAPLLARPAKIRSDRSSDCFDEPRHLGLVRHLEAGIQIRFERELPQQRQAERVDRADRDVAEPIAHFVPTRLVELRPRRRLLQLADDALPHLRRGLAGERDREDVARARRRPSAG